MFAYLEALGLLKLLLVERIYHCTFNSINEPEDNY